MGKVSTYALVLLAAVIAASSGRYVSDRSQMRLITVPFVLWNGKEEVKETHTIHMPNYINQMFTVNEVTADEEKKISSVTQCKELGCRDYLMKFNFALTLRADLDTVDGAHINIYTTTAEEFQSEFTKSDKVFAKVYVVDMNADGSSFTIGTELAQVEMKTEDSDGYIYRDEYQLQVGEQVKKWVEEDINQYRYLLVQLESSPKPDASNKFTPRELTHKELVEHTFDEPVLRLEIHQD